MLGSCGREARGAGLIVPDDVGGEGCIGVDDGGVVEGVGFLEDLVAFGDTERGVEGVAAGMR